MYTRDLDPLFPNREHWTSEGQVDVDESTLVLHTSVSQDWWTPALLGE